MALRKALNVVDVYVSGSVPRSCVGFLFGATRGAWAAEESERTCREKLRQVCTTIYNKTAGLKYWGLNVKCQGKNYLCRRMTYSCVRNLQMFIQICNLVWGFSRSLPKFWNVCKSKGYEFEKGKQ